MDISLSYIKDMQIKYTKRALKGIRKLPKGVQQKITSKIEAYAHNPCDFSPQIKNLIGSPFFRLRVGDYRVIMTKDGLVLMVLDVGHRKDIYKRMT